MLIFDEVQNLKMTKSKIMKRIDNSKISNPEAAKERDIRESWFKLWRKIYMGTIEVAYRPIRFPTKTANKNFVLFIIASQLPNIIQFYGLSIID